MVIGIVVGLLVGVLLAVFAYHFARNKPGGARDPVSLEEPKFESREFDANNPPRFMIYRPKSTGKELVCTNPGCYKPLIPGEKVLLWPVKHAHGSYDIYCNSCVALGKNS